MLIDKDAVLHSHDSEHPVTTALYTVMIVMTEEEPGQSDEEARERMALAFQDALDGGVFVDLRYDRFLFDVVGRKVLHIAPVEEAA